MAETTTILPTTHPKHESQDRLTTLPDTLLTDILSRLPITAAATTSFISRHFRHLWKSTTHLTLTTTSPNFTSIISHIIPQLTSSQLRHLTLNLSSPTDFPNVDVMDSSFRAILNSIVIEKVTINVVCSFYEEVFWAPKCLLTSRWLEELELREKVKFDLDSSEVKDLVDLPKLKRLKIDYLLDFPNWLGFLVRSCTSLEDLDLAVNLDVVESEIAERIDVICPNLKRLRIDLVAVNKVNRTLITVNAPEMEKIVIKDCISSYCFANDPNGLVDACVDLRRSDVFDEESEDDDDELDGEGLDDDGYLRRMCKFVLGMSNVTRLELKVDSRTNVFSYLSCVDDGFSEMFRNLVRFEATLDGVGPVGWEDLLLSMQRFPNLQHLKVNMEGDPPMENYDWCTPRIHFVPDCLKSVPDCLKSKLKTVQICGLSGTDDDLRLAAFVLNNARILEELRLDVFIKGEYNKILGIECVFCQSLFKFPRISSACEVVFSGRGVTTSSNTFNIEQFKGQMFSDA